MKRGGLCRAASIGLLLLAASTPLRADGPQFRPLTLDGFPVRWQPSGQSERIVLRYRVIEDEVDQPTAINCRHMRAPESLLQASRIELSSFRAALKAAFQLWRDVADVTFIEAEPGVRADIVIGEQAEPIGFAFTNLELADKTTGRFRPIVGASICLNPEKAWKIGYDGNLAVYDLVHTLTHEIGHVIGLDHPSAKGHLMSFRYSEERAGLSEGDRRGAISIYGPSRMRSLLTAEPATSASGATASPEVTSIIGRGIDGY